MLTNDRQIIHFEKFCSYLSGKSTNEDEVTGNDFQITATYWNPNLHSVCCLCHLAMLDCILITGHKRSIIVTSETAIIGLVC